MTEPIQTNGDPGPLELPGAITALRVAARDLEVELRNASQVFTYNPERFSRTVNGLGSERAARPPVCPDARGQWSDFLAGKRKDIEPRAVRFLCWEPDVATDPRFQDYLDQSAATLMARSLQGLLRSCHQRWTDELLAKDGVATRVRRRIEMYDGANRVVQKWRPGLRMLLGPTATAEMALDMVEGLRPIKSECALWRVEEQSRFMVDVVKRASEHCRDRLGRHLHASQFLLRELLPWGGWPIAEFKLEVGATILSPGIGELPVALDGFKRFVLQDDRLRDPRLPTNGKNWLGVPEEARQRFIQWLSRDDIELFFEHVLPRGSDPHGRKDFWLRYVKRVLKSRPLLNWRDQTRLVARMAQLRGQVGNYGRITGLADTSAFLLDFGRVVVVEFSQVGNACYIYEKAVAEELLPAFWSTEPFDVSGRRGLKQRSLAAHRVSHAGYWRDELANILARYGVRPLARDEQ